MAGLEDYIDTDAAAVAEGWRTLTTDQATAAESLIERAMPIVVSQSPNLLDRLGAGTTPPEAVEQVIIQAVRRAMAPVFNQDGVKRLSKAIDGEYSETVEWDTATLSAGLYFTPSELSLLAGPPRPRRGRAFSINQTPR